MNALLHEVTSRDGLVAAIRASVQPTYELARANPVMIGCGSANYHFKEGIHEARGAQIVRSILRTSRKAFTVAP